MDEVLAVLLAFSVPILSGGVLMLLLVWKGS